MVVGEERRKTNSLCQPRLGLGLGVGLGHDQSISFRPSVNGSTTPMPDSSQSITDEQEAEKFVVKCYTFGLGKCSYLGKQLHFRLADNMPFVFGGNSLSL